MRRRARAGNLTVAVDPRGDSRTDAWTAWKTDVNLLNRRKYCMFGTKLSVHLRFGKIWRLWSNPRTARKHLLTRSTQFQSSLENTRSQTPHSWTPIIPLHSACQPCVLSYFGEDANPCEDVCDVCTRKPVGEEMRTNKTYTELAKL